MILAGQSVVCVCVGESYVDEPLVGTVISPQIGELPVHLSLGEVLVVAFLREPERKSPLGKIPTSSYDVIMTSSYE